MCTLQMCGRREAYKAQSRIKKLSSRSTFSVEKKPAQKEGKLFHFSPYKHHQKHGKKLLNLF